MREARARPPISTSISAKASRTSEVKNHRLFTLVGSERLKRRQSGAGAAQVQQVNKALVKINYITTKML